MIALPSASAAGSSLAIVSPSGLLGCLRSMLDSVCTVFAQERTELRALRLALGHVITLGERTIARIIAGAGRDQQDWSADYRLFSRAKWSARELMLPVLAQALHVCGPIGKSYRKAVKAKHSSVLALNQILELRADLDACGATERTLIAALDGAFSNKTFFGQRQERVELISRFRRDAKLCFGVEPRADGKKTQQFYAKEKFTPEEVLKDETIPWQTTTVRTGGRQHNIRYKEIKSAYWQRGAGRNAVRVIVIAPTGYRLTKASKLLYRAPAFLVTTAMEMPVEELIQGYVDRWQIEVAHRELKDSFGLEDSQVRHASSVPRPASLP